MDSLLREIRQCVVCERFLPLGPNPVITGSPNSKIIIIGQAPGLKVHQTGIAWNDKSGDNLRAWMEMDKSIFYDPQKVSLMPMGFCYPGRGKSGDNPPRPECAPLWHHKMMEEFKSPKLILLVGKYAQDFYLKQHAKSNLTETVMHYYEYLPQYFPLPHPSPRNNIWQAKNKWFAEKVIPDLKFWVHNALQE